MQSTSKNALFCQLEWCWILNFEWVKTCYIPIYCQILIPEIPSFQGLPAGVAGADVCGSHEGRAPPGCEGGFSMRFHQQNWAKLVFRSTCLALGSWSVGVVFFPHKGKLFPPWFWYGKVEFHNKRWDLKIENMEIGSTKKWMKQKNMSFDNGQQRLTYIGKTVGNRYGGCENFLLRIDLLLEGAYSTDPAVPSQEVFRDISEIILRYFLREYVTLI